MAECGVRCCTGRHRAVLAAAQCAARPPPVLWSRPARHCPVSQHLLPQPTLPLTVSPPAQSSSSSVCPAAHRRQTEFQASAGRICHHCRAQSHNIQLYLPRIIFLNSDRPTGGSKPHRSSECSAGNVPEMLEEKN